MFRVIFLIVIVILIFYALFTFLKNFNPKEDKPAEQPKTVANDDPETFLKKVELEIELLQVKLRECEAEIKAGIVGSETRLENLKASLTRIEKLKEEYSNKK